MAVMKTRALLAASLLLAACGGDPARIELEPTALRFGVRGQTAKVHATPVLRSGKPAPDRACRWASSSDAVATVSGPHNDAVVTAAGPGSATVSCTIGAVSSAVAVSVRVVSRVVVSPERAALKVTDAPAPLALQVVAYDDAGAPVTGRAATTRCVDEDVCRGDGRAQLWAVGAGETTAVVEVEGARSAEIPVTVVDARTAAGRPQAVRGNPMEEIEREVRRREAEERKEAR
jgi:hypothetical protein